MRVRAIAETLVRELSDLPQATRNERLNAFVQTLHARRKMTLAPRIVAALAQLEAEAGSPPLAVTVAQPTPELPPGAEIAVSPRVVGGATVRAGDLMVDTTLSGQLKRLEHALKS
jgi:F0F1-type ATP synthase delta subunit